MKVSMKRMMSMTIGCGLALSGAGQVYADSVTIPNSFTAGSAAVAADVNANFNAVKSAVDDNDSRIAALEAQLDNLQDQVDAMDGNVTLDSLVGSTYCGISHWTMFGSDTNYARITAGEGTQTATFTSTTQLAISNPSDEEIELSWIEGAENNIESGLSVNQPSDDGGFVATINGLTNGVLSLSGGLTMYMSQHGDVMIHTDGAAERSANENELSGSIWVRCR